MFVSPQNSYVEALIPNGMVFRGEAFGTWLGHEGEPSWMGSVPLEEEARDHHVRIEQEGNYLQIKKRALTRHQICWHLDQDFAASSTARNKCLL